LGVPGQGPQRSELVGSPEQHQQVARPEHRAAFGHHQVPTALDAGHDDGRRQVEVGQALADQHRATADLDVGAGGAGAPQASEPFEQAEPVAAHDVGDRQGAEHGTLAVEHGDPSVRGGHQRLDRLAKGPRNRDGGGRGVDGRGERAGGSGPRRRQGVERHRADEATLAVHHRRPGDPGPLELAAGLVG
jgi:hypothetical protein